MYPAWGGGRVEGFPSPSCPAEPGKEGGFSIHRIHSLEWAMEGPRGPGREGWSSSGRARPQDAGGAKLPSFPARARRAEQDESLVYRWFSANESGYREEPCCITRLNPQSHSWKRTSIPTFGWMLFGLHLMF